jgi:hypothetical protein
MGIWCGQVKYYGHHQVVKTFPFCQVGDSQSQKWMRRPLPSILELGFDAIFGG